MKKKLLYGEGDWFAVPLRSEGWGVGRIARGRSHVLLGYFFGPRCYALPTLEEVERLVASDAVLVRMFGDLGLLRGEWPILGKGNDWDRSLWPMPEFCRHHADLDLPAYQVEYDENEPSRQVRCHQTAVEECAKLPRDGMAGSGAIEILLTRLLTDEGPG